VPTTAKSSEADSLPFLPWLSSLCVKEETPAAQAPLPGVYAAVDIVRGFANVDRYCGFLVLYQTPSGGDFKVMREELSFLDNGMAKTIQQQHSQAEVDKLWARLSAKCPNYRAGTVAEAPEPLPEQPDTA